MEHPSPRIQVLADDRERNSQTLAALRAMEDVELRWQRLKVGDYRVDGDLVVERKGLGDLLASIEDGHLFRQAKALASCGNRCMLLLEGRAEDIQTRGMRREAIQGARSASRWSGVCRSCGPRTVRSRHASCSMPPASCGGPDEPAPSAQAPVPPQGCGRRPTFFKAFQAWDANSPCACWTISGAWKPS